MRGNDNKTRIELCPRLASRITKNIKRFLARESEAGFGKGLRLFKYTAYDVDYTWFIVFVVFAWSLSYGYFPFNEPGLGRAAYILMGVSSSLLLFACVLAHELAHSITSNRLGLSVKNITLFIFGGIAELTKEPDDPKTELKIAVAGPIASAVLALFCSSIARAGGGRRSTRDPTTRSRSRSEEPTS